MYIKKYYTSHQCQGVGGCNSFKHSKPNPFQPEVINHVKQQGTGNLLSMTNCHSHDIVMNHWKLSVIPVMQLGYLDMHRNHISMCLAL